MIKDVFSSEFSKYMDRLPFIEDSTVVSITFSLNMLVIKYRKRDMKEIEILLQRRDKRINRIFHNLKSMKIYDKNVYIDYDTGSNFFPSRSYYNIYTILDKENVISTATTEKKDLKLLKMKRFIKLKPKIFGYLYKIPYEILGFKKIFLKFNREIYKGDLNLRFSNPSTRDEIIIYFLEDDAKMIKELTKDVILSKKNLGSSLYNGRIGKFGVLFSVLDGNKLLIFRCVRGEKRTLLKFTKKILEKIK